MANKPVGKKSSVKQGTLATSVTGRAEVLTVASILLITFIAFFPSLNNGFVNWDDFGYLRDNAIIKDFSFKNIQHVFNTSTDIKGNYHPLTILTYILEYHFFKLNPFYFHLNNLLLHLLNVLLVYVFIKMLLESGKVAGSNFHIAAVTTLLFAIHPLRVESVAWVSERKDVLYTFFFLAALCCYLLYLKKTHLKFYIFSIALFVLSVLSKGQAVVLAPVLLLIDYFCKRKFDKKLLLEKIPFVVLAVIFGIIAMSAQHTQLTEQRLQYYTFFQRVLIAGYGLVMYIYKLFLPVKLACFYPYPEKITGFFFVAPFLIVGLAFGAWRLAVASNLKPQTSSLLVFGALFFLISISIVLQLLPVGDAVIAERYTYIPYLGLFFIMASVYSNLLEQKKFKTLLVAGGVAYGIWLFVLTFNQTKVWKDSRTLWSSVLVNYPQTAVAYADRGLDYYEHNEIEKAHEDFNNAIKYKAEYHEAYNNRGLTNRAMKRHREAIDDFQTSFKLNPDYIIAAFNCGLTYIDVNKPDSAIYYVNLALKKDLNNPEYYYNLGIAYSAKGNNDRAIEYYTKAIALKPTHEGAYNNRGFIYNGQHQYDKAIADFSHSIEINSNNPLAFANRSAANYESKNYKAALEDALAAKSLGNDMGASYIELLKSKQ